MTMSDENRGCSCASQLAAELRDAKLEITRLHGVASDLAFQNCDLEIELATEKMRAAKGWGCLRCSQTPLHLLFPAVK